ncbi:MAG: dienelactone hydrolase family protein [Acidobacteria bacterium]|nr:dienelactone hydrolase family protein [Acidobacteriota bacterium]
MAGGFDFLAADPGVDAGQVSVIGFGWDGWRAWRLAERTLALHRAVVFYGTTSDDRRLVLIRAPVLGHYAGYDFQTTAQVLATKQRMGERFTYHVYPDRDRGFAGGGVVRSTTSRWCGDVATVRRRSRRATAPSGWRGSGPSRFSSDDARQTMRHHRGEGTTRRCWSLSCCPANGCFGRPPRVC